jgi:hypothetical protein
MTSEGRRLATKEEERKAGEGEEGGGRGRKEKRRGSVALHL